MIEIGGRDMHNDALSIGKLARERLISVKKVKDLEKTRDIVENYGLARGESEALTLAIETRGGGVVLDDLKAIKYCDKFDIAFTATINIIANRTNFGTFILRFAI